VSEAYSRDWEMGNAYGVLLDEPSGYTPAVSR